MTAFTAWGRRSRWVGLAGVALLAACSTAPPSNKTVLTGEKEVPPVTTTASGLSDISVRVGACPGASATDCQLIVGTVQTTGVAATAAHIHQGAVGQNGPVIVTLVQ